MHVLDVCIQHHAYMHVMSSSHFSFVRTCSLCLKLTSSLHFSFADFTIGQIAGMAVGALLFCLLITILPIVICCICCCCCSGRGASEWLHEGYRRVRRERCMCMCTLFVASQRNYKKHLQIHARTFKFSPLYLLGGSRHLSSHSRLANTHRLTTTTHMFTCI